MSKARGITLVLASLCVGLVVAIISHHLKHFSPVVSEQIIWQLRVPLVLTSILVGAGLTVGAAVLQTVLNNPLADPGIIGINSGASLTAALFLLVGSALPPFIQELGLPLSCFIGAMLSTLLIYALAKRIGNLSAVAVILAGIAISTLCAAIVGWLYWFADAQSLRNLTFWLMGNLHQANSTLVYVAACVLIPTIGWLFAKGNELNKYYLGADTAKTAGVDVPTLRPKLLIACALVVGVSVSLAGSIAFVGLLVPHLLRLVCGFDHRWLLPASALCGAMLMLLVVYAGQLAGGVALPVSMLTATLGGPLFLWVLIKRQAGGQFAAR